MRTDLPVYIGRHAESELVRYCHERGFTKFVLVADQNTCRAYGDRLEKELEAQGFDVIPVVLTGQEIIADEHYLVQVLLKADRQDRIYLAVGSGTLTDITRFVSFKTKTAFISVPTAPSVDGFTSIGAPLVIGGLKTTISCHGPLAVFADLDVLAAAPGRLIAAGMGDMVGKLMSVSDWKLGHVLWDEPYDDEIERRSRAAALRCIGLATEIGNGSAEGVQALMEGLIESGFCMLDFGSSAPASGAEHHMSHFWEMKLLREGRPAIFHGIKVGVASVLTAELYHKVARLSVQDVAERLQMARFPDRERLIQEIRTVYGTIADDVIVTQAPFLNMSESRFQQLKQRIVDFWPDVVEIAARVPAPAEFRSWLSAVGGPVEPQEIGFSDEDARMALQGGLHLRNRFTIARLSQLLSVTS